MDGWGEQSIGMHESQTLKTFFAKHTQPCLLSQTHNTKKKAGSKLELGKHIRAFFASFFLGADGNERESYLPRAPSLPLLSHAGAKKEL